MQKIDEVTPKLDSQRKFFGCEDWTDEDLDTMVGILRSYPGGEFLDKLGVVAQRNYAMCCIWLKENHNAKYQDGIVMGRVWHKNDFGPGYG